MNQSENEISSRTFKFLGCPIFQVHQDDTRKQRRVLGGLISTEKVSVGWDEEKIVRLLGFPIYRFSRIGNDVKAHVFNWRYRNSNQLETFMDQHSTLLKDHDHVYILNAHQGESIVFLRLALRVFEKNGSRNPLIIGTKGYHRSLVELICPDVAYGFVPNPKFSMVTDTFVKDKTTLFLAFTNDRFELVWEAIADPESEVRYFIDNLLSALELSGTDFDDGEFHVPDGVPKSVRAKADKIDLNLNNFVLVCPEATTCQIYDVDFWQALKIHLDSAGVDVFCNLVQQQPAYDSFKWCDLTITEIFELAKHAKLIVGLRSGLLDLLAHTKTPMFAIYTNAFAGAKFGPLPVERVLDAFTFEKFPTIAASQIEQFIGDPKLFDPEKRINSDFLLQLNRRLQDGTNKRDSIT